MQVRVWAGVGLLALACGFAFGGFGGDSVPASNAVLSEHELAEIEQMAPQQQALRLLQRAINGYRGALEQIDQRVGAWRGQLKMDGELQAMTNTAYNASNLRVRVASVEISIAAYGLDKSADTVEALIRDARDVEADRAWRLWAIGLLGNRGVAPSAARAAIDEHLRAADVETRKWAANSLAVLGSDGVIPVLTEVFRSDPSPEVRERAACGLADSGMFTREQRWKAIPAFLRAADDPNLDEQTRGWAFQALREISGESIASEASAWNDWWSKRQSR